MSAQQSAATAVPRVASHLVPFVVGFLLGEDVKEIAYEGGLGRTVRQGSGAMVVLADVGGICHALECLLADDSFRQEMGEAVDRTTIPNLTWDRMASAFPDRIGKAKG